MNTCLKALPLALVALWGIGGNRGAGAVEAVDATAAVTGGGFSGLPHDPGQDNGVFLDILATGSSSLVQPAYFQITTPADAPSVRVAIFDGNVAGLWDQGDIGNNPDGSPQILRDGGQNAVLEYDLAADGDVADATGFVPFSTDPSLTFAIADSEDVSVSPGPAPTQRPGAVIFRNANDARWEFLYDGAHDPRALVALTGEHRYVLRVRYRTPIASSIAGYKLAANGFLEQRPLTLSDTLLGGFIGGVVDNRRLAFDFPNQTPGLPFSVSRDHYPNILKPLTASLNASLSPSQAGFAPAVRFGPGDTYDNPFNGSFDIHFRLVPKPGQTWEQMFQDLILSEGDADNANPIPLPNMPPNPGLPRDDGQPHLDANNRPQNNTGYRIPVAGAIPFDPPADNSGAPWVEVFAPSNALFATDTDTSGNVAQEDSTGQSFKDLKPYLPATGGTPGIWTLRMHNLDARNTWFLRTNAKLTRDQCAGGRVVCDAGCDGRLGAGDSGIAGVVVTLTRTDVPNGGSRTATTDALGVWEIDHIPVGTYSASIAPNQPALAGKTPTTPQPIGFRLGLDQCRHDLDFGYCCECQCGPDGHLHRICFEADIWYPDPNTPNPDPDVYVRLDAGCCPGQVEDLACFSYTGAFPGPQVGRNGVITVQNVVIEDGVAKVFVCLEATAPIFPRGYFQGSHRIEVVVNGVSEAVCTPIECDVLSIGGTIPADWHPRWCGDEPVYHVLSWVPFACIEKPCTDGCVRPRAFWRAVNKYGECDATRYAWPCAGGEDRTLCGKTWLQILRKDPRCDTWTWLAQQWIVVRLNSCAGACVPPAVRRALDEASSLLTDNCDGFAGQWLVDERAALVAKILEQYNSGKAGPKACDCTIPKCPPCKKPKGNNGVGNGEDPQPPGNPPVNDGDGTSPGDPGNRGGAGDKGSPSGGSCKRTCPDVGPAKPFSEFPCAPSCDDKCKDCKDCKKCKDGDKPKGCDKCKGGDKPKDCDKPKGNNGVGNGEDPQPPGDPPVNDGQGTSTGSPGNQGGHP